MTNKEVAVFISNNPVWHLGCEDIIEHQLICLDGGDYYIAHYDDGWRDVHNDELILHNGNPIQDKDIVGYSRLPRFVEEYEEAGDSTAEQLELFQAIEDDDPFAKS